MCGHDGTGHGQRSGRKGQEYEELHVVEGVNAFFDWSVGDVWSILHEVLHAFLTKYGCRQCQTRTPKQGQDNHARAFMLIAKAIEEQSIRLLGVNVDINRLTSWSLRGGQDGTSIHDLERYGFIDPLVGDEEAGDTEDCEFEPGEIRYDDVIVVCRGAVLRWVGHRNEEHYVEQSASVPTCDQSSFLTRLLADNPYRSLKPLKMLRLRHTLERLNPHRLEVLSLL